MDEAPADLIREIAKRKEELRERELSLPAHSIQPHQLMILEELENKINELEEKLSLFDLRKVKEERG